MSRLPGVMVSSTYFDLRQVRADLAHFIEQELGYRALLSEFATFPVDPDLDTIDNCRRRVEGDADILVLLIGGRYGFVDSNTSKSITNIEYLSAKAKGIPIYAFVDKQVLAILPIWEKNPTADFTGAVSDTRVFEFIRSVRSEDRVWTREFELASDITMTLRMQFAYLMQTSLQATHRLGHDPNSVLNQLHGKSLRYALEKPDFWEHRLFLQVLCDEVRAYADLRQEHRLNLVIGMGEKIPLSKTHHWFQRLMRELERLVRAFNLLMTKELQEALGPEGVSGDAEKLVFVGRKMGMIYRSAIEWSQRVKLAQVHRCYRVVHREMSVYTENMIRNIEEYGPKTLATLEAALLNPPKERTVINAVLTIGLDNQDALLSALHQATIDCAEVMRKRYGA